MSLLLRLAYDGCDFHGFARQKGLRGQDPQKNLPRTVQDILEQVLAEIYQQTVITRGASRTDAGVHAAGQLVAFDPPFAIPTSGLLRALNSKLSPSISVLAGWEEQGETAIDPRLQNQGKHYRYRIRCTPWHHPNTWRYEWFLPGRLYVQSMHEAGQKLIGQHDFSSFRASTCQAKNPVRMISKVVVWAEKALDLWPADACGFTRDDQAELVLIDIYGTAFLHKMVRIIVGTLVEVGQGRRAPESIEQLLHTPDRRRAGITAPARGLTLMEVLWSKQTK